MAEATSVQQAAENEAVSGLLVRRWFGAWLDLLAMALLVFLPGVAALLIRRGDPMPETLSTQLALAGCGLALLYFPLLEGVWGRSLGKFAAGLRVVDRHGRPPGIGRAIVRTLTRLIEVNPVLAGGVPAGIFVLSTKRRQRLGDLIADTYVLPASSIAQITIVDQTLADLRARQDSAS